MADIFSVASKSAGGDATVVWRSSSPCRDVALRSSCKSTQISKFSSFSKFCPIKEKSEGILMMLWVVVSSEVLHLLLWFNNPWLRTHRLREKQIHVRNFLNTPYLYTHGC